MKCPVRLLPLIALALLLCACGPGNNVRLLTPPPLDNTVLPAPNAPRVSVVNFVDKREQPASIGTRRDGSAFVTNGNPCQWISRALADELARHGLQVTFANTSNEGRLGNPDYLVTGQLDQLWLKENSAMDLSTMIRVNCTLANRKGRLWTETINASQNRSSLPSGSAAEKILLDTMRDLVKPMAQKIIRSIENKK